MAKGKQYRDKFGRFAKRGQPSKPPQPRVNGRYVSRPKSLVLRKRQGKRVWVQSGKPPKKKKQKGIIGGGRPPITQEQERTILDRGDIYEEVSPEPPPEVARAKSAKAAYGYDLDEFLSKTDHPEGYSYVTLHIFYDMKYRLSRHGGGEMFGNYITVRGRQYNSVEDLREGIDEELEEIFEATNEDETSIQQGGEGRFYVRTIVQVIPQSGANRVPGAVYPKDYVPPEGTVAYGRQRLLEFGKPLPGTGKKLGQQETP